jgi:hypothetical protein
MKIFSPEVYLGDGLYIAHSPAGAIRLRAPRVLRDDVVFLEVETYLAMLEYVAGLANPRPDAAA